MSGTRCQSAEAATQWVAIVNHTGREPSPLNTFLTMTAFEEYTEQYGYHFNRKLYEYAVSMMKDRAGKEPPVMTKEQAEDWLKTQGVTLKNNKGYDAAYVLAMGRADYFGSSVKDNIHLALFVKDFLDDPDGHPTKAFDHFVMDCKAKEEYIYWEDFL